MKVKARLLLRLLTTILLHGVNAQDQEHDSTRVTFRNELPKPMTIYWEGQGGSSEQGDNEQRIEQGTVSANGGEISISSYPYHQFTYDFGGFRHLATVPHNNHGGGAYLVLTANQDITVRCTTSINGNKGEYQSMDILVKPSWSPRGASRFLELVRGGYYNGVALNRVVKGFLTQFGIARDYNTRSDWRENTILDDPVDAEDRVGFQPGMLAYAGSGENSRTTEIFVVMPGTAQHQLEYFGTNPWETPFGMLVGSSVEESPVAKWHAYGDMPPWGEGPDPQKIYPGDGYEYLNREFPDMDYIQECEIVQEWPLEEAEEL